MTIHERTTKWSKDISEMDVLSLAEKEVVCNTVAKQLFVICVTMATLILIAIIVGMFESPWLLEYMTNTADIVNQNSRTVHFQVGQSGGTMASLSRMIPVLATMLIPTIGVFFMIKKAFTQKGNKKISRKEISSCS